MHRPSLPGGAWPPGARPAVFFAPGNGQNIVVADDDPTELYPEILRALAAQGVVVFAAQPTFPLDPTGQNNWNSSKRTASAGLGRRRCGRTVAIASRVDDAMGLAMRRARGLAWS